MTPEGLQELPASVGHIHGFVWNDIAIENLYFAREFSWELSHQVHSGTESFMDSMTYL
jgi:hypothetical protein